MKRASYAAAFTLAVASLSLGGLMAFRRLEANAAAARAAAVGPATESVPTPASALLPFTPVAPDPTEYAKYAEEDARWRARHARQYSLNELRIRGDGTRSQREVMEDRVYAYTRRGNYRRAIAELEGWVERQPRDQQALLELARMLSDNGRNADAVARYRQLLAVKRGKPEE